MRNHNSMRSTGKHPGILGTVIFLLCCAAGSTGARAQQAPPHSRIDLDQAIQLALAHNHALKAAQSQIPQSQAQEITAARTLTRKKMSTINTRIMPRSKFPSTVSMVNCTRSLRS